MNARGIILIVVALVLAGLAAFFARTFIVGEEQVVEAAKGPNVLVARRPLPIGKIIDNKDFSWLQWPVETVHPGYIIEGKMKPNNQPIRMADYIGRVVRDSMVAGEPITVGKLVRPGQRGFMAAILKPGMRAITLSVTRITGVAGFVFPGDRVDILLSRTATDDNGILRQVTETSFSLAGDVAGPFPAALARYVAMERLRIRLSDEENTEMLATWVEVILGVLDFTESVGLRLTLVDVYGEQEEWEAQADALLTAAEMNTGVDQINQTYFGQINEKLAAMETEERIDSAKAAEIHAVLLEWSEAMAQADEALAGAVSDLDRFNIDPETGELVGSGDDGDGGDTDPDTGGEGDSEQSGGGDG